MKKYLAAPWFVATYHLFSKNRVLILVVVMALLSTGCTGKISDNNHSVVDSASTHNKQNLSSLKIGILPTENRTEQERMIKPLKEY